MQEQWDEYISRLSDKDTVTPLFLEHLERIHDTIGTAQRIADSRFGPESTRDATIVLPIVQWILNGPAPWQKE